jgi:thiopeptide-type bacteriocin biosynthesis protein
VSTAVADRRPPGSDWLFLKAYTGPDLEDDLLSGPVRTLVADAAALGVRDWFFLRYGDPERHIRLRFHGEPGHLLGTLLPHVTTWAADQLAAGLCRRFAVDTYEREIERYGGLAGCELMEQVAATDSDAALAILAERMSAAKRRHLAVASVAGLGAPYRELAMLLVSGLSLAFTPRAVREANRFTFHAIYEVAALFAGIFLTMLPALDILHARGPELGELMSQIAEARFAGEVSTREEALALARTARDAR